MKLLCRLSVLTVICTFITGCLFEGRQTDSTVYYDLGNEFPIYQKKLGVGTISATASYNTRMVFRTETGNIDFAEFHRWAVPPAQLIENLLVISFEKSTAPVIDLHISQLEMDELNSKFIFSANYTLKKEGERKSHRFSYSQKVDKAVPVEFSKAFRTATLKLLKEINDGI